MGVGGCSVRPCQSTSACFGRSRHLMGTCSVSCRPRHPMGACGVSLRPCRPMGASCGASLRPRHPMGACGVSIRPSRASCSIQREGRIVGGPGEAGTGSSVSALE
jgi:hypothetical protein